MQSYWLLDHSIKDSMTGRPACACMPWLCDPLLIHRGCLLHLRIFVSFGSESGAATGHSAKAIIKVAGGITRTRSEGHQFAVSCMHRCFIAPMTILLPSSPPG